MLTLKRFEGADWAKFPGAMKFSDQVQPWAGRIYLTESGNVVDVVVDLNGVTVINDDISLKPVWQAKDAISAIQKLGNQMSDNCFYATMAPPIFRRADDRREIYPLPCRNGLTSEVL